MIPRLVRSVEHGMEETIFRWAVKKSYAAKIQQVAVKAERGNQVENELLQLVTTACAHVCSLNKEEPWVAIQELIESIKARSKITLESQKKAQAVFALAIMQAEVYLVGTRR